GESLGLGVHGRMTGDCGDERLLAEPVEEGPAARDARRRLWDIAEERDLSESIAAAERREGGPLALDADRARRDEVEPVAGLALPHGAHADRRMDGRELAAGNSE